MKTRTHDGTHKILSTIMKEAAGHFEKQKHTFRKAMRQSHEPQLLIPRLFQSYTYNNNNYYYYQKPASDDHANHNSNNDNANSNNNSLLLEVHKCHV